MSTDGTKGALRQALVAARRALLPGDREERSRRIAARVVLLDAFLPARTVALYASMGGEVQTTALWQAARDAGKRVAFPVLTPAARRLTFASCDPDDLVPGAHGTREPPAGCEVVPSSDLEVIVVPGVAFDPGCHRLGRGRGAYDATLADPLLRAFRVGLAFELQIVPEVPREPHDVALDAVVTEDRVLFRLPSVAGGGRSCR